MSGYGLKEPLWFLGVVENNVDQRLEGRVQVRAFNVHGTNEQVPTQDLPWATLIIGNYDTNFIVPPVNSWVFGFFVDGRDAQQPMILGLIPTQMTKQVNPKQDGYGAIPNEFPDLLSMGSRPQDFGQPMNSPLARGENLEQTYNVVLETNRVKDIEVPNSKDKETWEEPSSAYAAQYPFNRVIETAGGHSIELDDTPGSERIMIWHRSGSYVQIDSRGTTTHKATSDKYEINELNQHVYVGGKSMVVVEGDCNVVVKGSKLEEIHGDYKTIVHGNHELSVAGQMNFNVSDEIQARAAKITIESNVEDVSLKSGKSIRMESGESIYSKSGTSTIQSSAGLFSILSDDLILTSQGTLSMRGDNAIKIGSAAQVSISGTVVAMDDIIQMSNGLSESPDAAEESIAAKSVTLSEPAAKYAYTASTKNYSSGGTAGFSSVDTSGEGSDNLDGTLASLTSSCGTSLIDEIKKQEKFSATAYWDEKQYSVGYGLRTDNPNEVISEEEASKRLETRLVRDRNTVRNYGLSKNYNWNDCQLDAMTSFVYNLGTGVLDQVTNNGQRSNEEIAEAMLQYNGVIDSNGNKKIPQGLVNRRNSESNWFKDGSSKSGTASGGELA